MSNDVKRRFELIASSLGSYFGVGFKTPDEQIEIDLGLVPNDFDDAAQDRMDLGSALEDAVLDYFQKKFDMQITDRNTETLWAFDDMLKCKVDGKAEVGENKRKTVIECKVSNSQSGPFTDNMGYIIQCQCYMEATGYDQAILLGLYQGKPIYRVIERDEEMIADIREVVEFVYNVLTGLEDFSNYPTHILEKYSKTKLLADIEDITDEDQAKMERMAELKIEMKNAEALKTEYDALADEIKTKYADSKYAGSYYSVAIATKSRKGSIDESLLSIEHPEIDLSQYRKPDSKFTTVNLTLKKGMVS
jgi:hypothetical protein